MPFVELDLEAPPSNPFKILREAAGLSHANLGKIIRVSKHSLIRLEQGLYDQPLPTVLEWWLDEGRNLNSIKASGLIVTELRLINGYEEFQNETRRRNYRYFGDAGLSIDDSALCPHPCIQLERKAESLGKPCSEIGIAKALCVPQSTLNLWKRKYRTQQSVPKTVQSALLQIGYTRFEVAAFMESYTRWREATI